MRAEISVRTSDNSPLGQRIRMRNRHSSSGRRAASLLCCSPLSDQSTVLVPARHSQSVSIQVQADQSEGRDLTGLELFRLRRTQLHLRSERQETARRTSRDRRRPVYVRVHNLLTDRRRDGLPEVGIDERLFRRCLGTSGLQLGDSGPDFRHVSRSRR